jgi:hypothetical protein
MVMQDKQMMLRMRMKKIKEIALLYTRVLNLKPCLYNL